LSFAIAVLAIELIINTVDASITFSIFDFPAPFKGCKTDVYNLDSKYGHLDLRGQALEGVLEKGSVAALLGMHIDCSYIYAYNNA